MGVQHPTEGLQRKQLFLWSTRQQKAWEQHVGVLRLALGSITLAVPQGGRGVAPRHCGWSCGLCMAPVALEVVEDMVPSLLAPIAGLSLGT